MQGKDCVWKGVLESHDIYTYRPAGALSGVPPYKKCNFTQYITSYNL